MMILWLTAVARFLAASTLTNAFTVPPCNLATCPGSRYQSIIRANSQQLFAAKTTLSTETTWRLRLLLNDLTTTRGKKLEGQLFVVEGHFVEEEGYEPPQGLFKPTNDSDVEEGISLEISNSYWKLSEDPNDPKDGLWIWGLFKEPLYPFMLLQIETKELKLSSSQQDGNDGAGDSIPPLKLYAQISHIRSDEAGVELKTANLNVRVLEQIQLPGASVDLYEEEKIGQVSFQPL